MTAAAPKLTPSERAARAEKARVARGDRVVRVILPADAVRALEALTERHGWTMTEAIARSLDTRARADGLGTPT